MELSLTSFGSYLKKARLMGWRGIVGYLNETRRRNKLKRILLANAQRHPCATPEKGITLLFDATSGTSLSKVMRDFAFALKATGIPFQTYDIGPGTGPITKSDLTPILTPVNDFRVARYSHIIEIFSGCGLSLPGHTRSVIVFAEFPKGLKTAHPLLCGEQSFIGMSDFVTDILRNTFPNRRVNKILYPFRFAASPPNRTTARRKFGFAEDDFIVFYNFDFGSSYGRKNPLGALNAFIKAFPSETNAKLVFKTMHAHCHPNRVNELMATAAAAGMGDRVVFQNKFLSQDDLYALTACADVYLALHRGEGFGLGATEAMCLGIPAVVTDVSSTTEFCSADTAVPIPYTTIRIDDDLKDHTCYTEISEWPEPDTNLAASALRELYNDPDRRRQLGERARQFINEHFAPEEFKRSVEDYLSST